MSTRISIITVFDQLYGQFLKTGLIRRAQEKNIVSIDVTSFFSYVTSKERIDGPICGPGVGMLIRPPVVERAIEEQESLYGVAFKIFFSPQGKKLDQHLLKKIAFIIMERRHLMLIPARYEGMDQRIEDHYADMVLSVGDFVLMSGDIPAMMLLEGCIRLIPGVINKKEAIKEESFYGPFVDYPVYTTPVEWKGHTVPAIVRSGNHKKIAQWRKNQAIQKTVSDHFSWLRSFSFSEEERKNIELFLPSHYVALLHSNVLVGEEKKIGYTSVTSLDIHDIARSSCTYGVKRFFMVTPLVDQQHIVQQLLNFWQSGHGSSYNKNRSKAIALVQLSATLDDVIAMVEKEEGKKPLLVATSAHPSSQLTPTISYHDQSIVWQSNRPVILLFGTGKGLSDQVIKQCDFLLLPIFGFSNFNHLSVRSAAAVILDRWIGINPGSHTNTVLSKDLF